MSLPTSYDMLGAFQNFSLCPLSMARSLNSQVDEQQLVVGQEEWSIVERRWLSCFCVLINLLTILANHNLLTIYGEKCISSIGYPYVSLHNTYPYSEAILMDTLCCPLIGEIATLRKTSGDFVKAIGTHP